MRSLGAGRLQERLALSRHAARSSKVTQRETHVFICEIGCGTAVVFVDRVLSRLKPQLRLHTEVQGHTRDNRGPLDLTVTSVIAV